MGADESERIVIARRHDMADPVTIAGKQAQVSERRSGGREGDTKEVSQVSHHVYVTYY